MQTCSHRDCNRLKTKKETLNGIDYPLCAEHIQAAQLGNWQDIIDKDDMRFSDLLHQAVIERHPSLLRDPEAVKIFDCIGEVLDEIQKICANPKL